VTFREPAKEDTMRAVGVTPRDADDERELGAGGERSDTPRVTETRPEGRGHSRSGRRRPPRTSATGFDSPDRDQLHAEHAADLAVIAFGLHLAERADRELALHLCNVIGSRHSVRADVVLSDNRHPDVMAARRSLCRVLKGMGWSLIRTGRAIGRDHTTVLQLLRS
jgi:hypothetical protein